METSKFLEMCSLNVNEYVEKKNNLSYLSWSFAWKEFKRSYPEATYEIKEFENRPYLYDEKLGYMVMTGITAGGQTLSMWLPVMDNTNKAMKDQDYEIVGKYKTVTVKAATMFDINTAIMRCLVKNIAMFGLGLYIYAGEDIPKDEIEHDSKPVNKSSTPTDINTSKSKKSSIIDLINACKTDNELRELYKGHKTELAGNREINELFMNKAAELKKGAA